MKSTGKGLRPIVLLSAVALASLAAGFTASHYLFPNVASPDNSAECVKKYSLLRGDIDCTSVNDDYERVNKIQDDLNAYIDQQKTDGNVTRVSIFFRDLSSRRWAAVNKDEKYAPGSMLKVVIAIAYYKLAEVEPQILSQEYIYNPTAKSMNDIETFKPKDPLIPGKSYTVKELITHTIIDSDNETATLLSNSIDKSFLDKVFSDLGILLPTTGGGEENFLGVETYSGILRTLYLAAYLNANNSQEVLSLMTKASFPEGITNGVSDDVPVAHKFGERKVIDPKTGAEETAELHDCGIIYKTNHPYILCIMTEGTTYDHLANVLTGISKIVFQNE